MRLNRRGQNVAEYAILIALVIGAAMAMQTYVKRGLQGRIKGATDTNIGKTFGDVKFTTSQYEPYYADTNATVESGRNSHEDIGQGMQVDRTVEESTLRKGASTVGLEQASHDNQAYNASDWNVTQ